MGIITEDETFPSSFNFNQDMTFAFQQVDHARYMLSRRYIFVGETHNSPYDKERTYGIATRYAGDKDYIVVAERAIFDANPGLAYLEATPNVIHEANMGAPPGAYIRNVEIVEQIIRETDKDAINRRYSSPRPVVILFGQDHETGIRQELMAQMPIDARICWWSFPSLKEQLYALPTLHVDIDTLNRNNFEYVGICEGLDVIQRFNVEVIMKGRWPGQFSVPVEGLHTAVPAVGDVAVFLPRVTALPAQWAFYAAAHRVLQFNGQDSVRFARIDGPMAQQLQMEQGNAQYRDENRGTVAAALGKHFGHGRVLPSQIRNA